MKHDVTMVQHLRQLFPSIPLCAEPCSSFAALHTIVLVVEKVVIFRANFRPQARHGIKCGLLGGMQCLTRLGCESQLSYSAGAKFTVGLNASGWVVKFLLRSAPRKLGRCP
jgi:hypothetical protein